MTEPSLTTRIANGALFNLSWLLIVSSESLAIALPVLAAHLLLHFACFSRNPREWVFIGAVGLVGALLDQLLFAAGVFQLNGAPALAPLWLSCLWPALATTACHAFAGMQRQLPLCATIGALGGMGSYAAGTAMTTVNFAQGATGLAIIGVLWAVLFPLMLKTARVASLRRAHEPGLA